MNKIFRINEENASPTLIDGLILAERILSTPKCYKVRLQYNFDGATIKDVINEFNDGIQVLTSDESPEIYAFFDEINPGPEYITFNTDLVQLCRHVVKGTNGYSRLVFFIAMVTLHESSHWKFCNFGGKIKQELGEPNNEAGECTEIQLLKGIINLNYEDKDAIELKILKANARFKIDSPDSEQYTKDIEQGLSPKIIEKKYPDQHSTPVLFSNSCKNSITKRKLKISIDIENEKNQIILTTSVKNINSEIISVPKDFKIGFFHIKVKDPNGYVMSTRRTKLGYLDRCTLVELNPNEQYTYRVCLNEHFKFTHSGLYEISLKFSGINDRQNMEIESDELHAKFLFQNDEGLEIESKTGSSYQINIQDLPKHLCIELLTSFERKKE